MHGHSPFVSPARASQLAPKSSHPAAARGFTLIELLVVITIIALLIGILLPSLRKSRLAAYQAVSLANIRSIGTAGGSYQADNKGSLPVVPTGVPVPATINAWITWGGWGKHTSTWWHRGGGIFDINPAKRPLNPYLYSGPYPGVSERYPAGLTAKVRSEFQIPVFRDPSDRIGHQQTWDAFLPSFGVASPNTDNSSCYEDVGTSYLLQVKWFFQTTRIVGGSWTRAWKLGCDRLRVADSFAPSRMIWINDEYCDITINQVSSTAKIVNGYGDTNKAIVGFLDGHAKYLTIIPGGENDPNAPLRPWLVPAYNNSEYTVVFPDLRP